MHPEKVQQGPCFRVFIIKLKNFKKFVFYDVANKYDFAKLGLGTVGNHCTRKL